MITADNRFFKLDTDNTSYVFFAHENGALVHLYYGKYVSDVDLSNLYDEEAIRSFCPYEGNGKIGQSLSITPTEYAGFQTGDYRLSSIRVERNGGFQGTKYIFESYRVIDGHSPNTGLPLADKEGTQTLVVSLKDKVSDCGLDLYYTVYQKEDVITRYSRVYNGGEKAARIKRIMSCQVDFNRDGFDAYYLAGSYCDETHLQKTPLSRGTFSLSSRFGFTGHCLNPAVILAEKTASDKSGDIYAFNLLYSGNFLAQAEEDCFGNTRFVNGINDEGFSWVLEGGEAFYSPESVLCYAEGFDEIRHRQHNFIRNRVLRKLSEKYPPMLFNTWEANYFDVSEEIVLEYLDYAKKLGLDTLVTDDGWFSNRNDDTVGLGDWFVNTKKFPSGIKGVSDKVHSKGLKFGIWIEPEMVNPLSQLAKTHPEWILGAKDREKSLSRNQLVLDFSNAEVIDYLEDSFKKVFEGCQIDYFKWDANRYLTEVGSEAFNSERQGEVSHRYVLGVYDLYRRMHALFPNAVFEGCSGGGGRFDLGMMRYNNDIWASDNTDAYERGIIAYDGALFYPPKASTVHFADDFKVGTRRLQSMYFRFSVCLSGAMGVEFDVKNLSEEDFSLLSDYIEKYKELRPLVLDGDYYSLISATDGKIGAISYVSKDKNSALAVFWQILGRTNHRDYYLKFKGLKDKALYKLSGDVDLTLHGDTLMNVGVRLPYLHGDGQALIIELKKVD